MPFYEKGDTRIYYEEVGSGFPLLIIPGGGLNSTVAGLRTSGPFNPMETYKNDFRCIAADLRNAPPGQSTGPLEIDRPWDAHSDDQLGLMDYLGIGEFLVMGFCIGGPMIHNLLRLASDHIVAAALMQPSGFRPEMPDIFYQNNIAGWGLPLCEKRPQFTMDVVHDFLTSMYTDRADFVFTVSRDFVRGLQTPILTAPRCYIHQGHATPIRQPVMMGSRRGIQFLIPNQISTRLTGPAQKRDAVTRARARPVQPANAFE